MLDVLKNVVLAVLLCFILAIALIACSESITNPLTPGSGLLTKDVTIRDTVLYAESDTTYVQKIAMDGIFFSPLRQNLIGKNGNYTAHTVLRFFPPPRDTIKVLSAKLTLRLISWRGDSSGRFGFTIHKILSPWSQGTATWDTLNASGFFESTPRNSYPEIGTVGVGADTQSITLALDTALVRSWYNSTDHDKYYGILLKPSSGCSIIRGIHAFDFDSSKYWPKLEVIAINNAGTVFDTTTFQVTSTGAGAGSDTYAADVNPFPINIQRIYSQAGIVYRSNLKFNVSQLPQGAVITSASLSLTRDPSLSNISKFTSSSQPTVHAGVATDSTKFESISSAGNLKSGTSNIFEFDVRRQVQLWENGSNFGLILRQSDVNEFGTLDLYSFYNRRAPADLLRPRIAVKYTTFN